MKASEKYTDIELVEKILAGEIELFEVLIRRYNDVLYKTGRSYKYNHEDTQDLMQDTYINAYTNLSGFEKRSTFKTWIIKIMLNNCYKHQQKWNFKNIIPGEVEDKSIHVFSNHQHTDTSNMVINKELSQIIENALQALPFYYRMVFTLREMNGLNVSETADTLHISDSNVKVRLNRAKAMLRRAVRKSYSTNDIFEFNRIYCDALTISIMEKIRVL